MQCSNQVNKDSISLKKTIRSLCNKNVRRPLTYEQVKKWIKQFDDGPEELLALLILRYLIYRTNDQLKSSIKQALKYAALSQITENQGFGQVVDWKDLLSNKVEGFKFFFGPTQFDYSVPGKSGEIISRMLKNNFSINSSQLAYPIDFKNKSLQHNERYFLVDDAIYTGKQVNDFLNEHGDFMTSSEQSAIVVGLAHEDAINFIKKTHPNIPVFYGEKITSKECFVSLSDDWVDDEIWQYAEQTPQETYNHIVKNKAKFDINSDLYGYGNLGCLIAFEHGIPDNTLSLLWDESATWEPLIPRS